MKVPEEYVILISIDGEPPLWICRHLSFLQDFAGFCLLFRTFDFALPVQWSIDTDVRRSCSSQIRLGVSTTGSYKYYKTVTTIQMSKHKCVFSIMAITVVIMIQLVIASAAATATQNSFYAQTSFSSTITNEQKERTNPLYTCAATDELSARQTPTDPKNLAQVRVIHYGDAWQGGVMTELGRRRQQRSTSGMMGKRKLSLTAVVAAVRGGAAGAWRVVDPERRKERQAVRNVLLYYPNLIGAFV